PYPGFDRIADFVRGADKIDLSKLDADAATAGVQDFTFIGTAAFSADATGELRYSYSASKGYLALYGSTDADASAEFAVQLTGVTALAAGDILF
ncbi:MAG TPA: M10 family metallopeptidase C-terminal domain-containing protein, partial [Ramlibacter sp.]